MRVILALLISTSFGLLQAQSNRIILDEDYADWTNINVLGSDPAGDQGNGVIDFENLWAANDEDFLFLRFDLGVEINLQEGNEVTIYLDTDNDNTTGLAVEGIGANLVYNLGDRSGTVYLNSNSTTINHADINLVSSPTVSSDQFEIAISRDAMFQGQSLFSGNEVRVLLRNAISNADQIPDFQGGLSYTFQDSISAPLPSYSIEKLSDLHTRVLSYNVLRDDLFDPSKQANYSRILKAIGPDIIGFQEIYDNSSTQTAAKVNSFLPAQWYHAKVNPDVIAVSKYPIISSHNIAPGGNGAFLIDMSPLQLLFIVAHPPCCSNNSGRQEEIDGIMAFIRDAKNGIGPINLPANSPIIIVGDMNLVGFNQQVTTFLTGDIIDQNTYGADFDPDWDSTALEDVKPLTTNLPMSMTWYNEGSSFSPGRLDYIIYSGSVMSLENSFVLFTPTLTPSELTTYDLQANDVTIASDHLPVVADFDFGTSTAIYQDNVDKSLSLSISPNPLQERSTIYYILPQSSSVQINIFDAAGRKVFSQQTQNGPGSHSANLNASAFTAGIYYCQLVTDYGSKTSKFVIAE
ncbi:MAG: endonuclease/exonuclease/phosphatase family protein [Bacteroidia bacterium]